MRGRSDHSLSRHRLDTPDDEAAREEALRAEVRDLRIEIDEGLQSRKVAEITETEYFRDLRGRAGDLRRMVREQPAADDPAEPSG